MESETSKTPKKHRGFTPGWRRKSPLSRGPRGLGERIGLDQDTSQRRRHDRLPSGPPFLGLKNQSLLGICFQRWGGSVYINNAG